MGMTIDRILSLEGDLHKYALSEMYTANTCSNTLDSTELM